MRFGLVDLWATRENRSVVKAIMAWASLRFCSGVRASLQSPGAFFRAVWPRDSCRGISGVSGVEGSAAASVLKIPFIGPVLGGSRALLVLIPNHTGNGMLETGSLFLVPLTLSLQASASQPQPQVPSTLLIGPPPSDPAHSSPAPPVCTWLPNMRKLSGSSFSWVGPLTI